VTHDFLSHTRRSAVLSAFAAAAALAPGAQAEPTAHEQDWAWLVGRWRVRHRQLKGRLVGASEWIEFPGTSQLWLTMGGLGTVDDNVIEKPDGTYRAMTVRAFDAKRGQWAIWWADGRNPESLDPPVRGRFENGAGLFLGDDVLDGRPIKVRFIWSKIATATPRWEQAFSADGGANWETNWIMEFTRA
jgi:hypothetical protein